MLALHLLLTKRENIYNVLMNKTSKNTIKISWPVPDSS